MNPSAAPLTSNYERDTFEKRHNNHWHRVAHRASGNAHVIHGVVAKTDDEQHS